MKVAIVGCGIATAVKSWAGHPGRCDLRIALADLRRLERIVASGDGAA